MAVYKVIQDIESEDKLLGPLTLKGFIYALIAGGCAFIEVELLMRVNSPIKYPFIFMFALPMILFGVLASPLGREQPTEVWLLSRIRFFLKPRARIWDQEGISDLVTITVPKKVERHLSDGLSQTEVKSRLKTLATTLDTRGWAIKNVDVNLSVPEVEAKNSATTSDRLVSTVGLPSQMPVVDIHAADDILDEKNNPTAKKFDTMMKQADAKRKHSVLEVLRELVDDGDNEKPHPKKSKKHEKQAAAAKSTKDLPATKEAIAKARREYAAKKAREQADWEARIAERLSKARSAFSTEFEQGHKKDDPAHHVVGPIKPRATPKAAAATPVTPTSQTANMELAQSGNAFSVATLSQLANRQPKVEQSGPDEVTISLH
ncbi:PrgI family protein [Candidatus Saccharibacteria bacterium]|nr:PrgI family protein [Candidatus Saccharibacteria bacterium]